MLKRLKKLYIQEQFNPKILGLFINPFYFARKGLYQSVSVLILNLKGKLLDVGCGTKPYEGMCNVDKYIGLEIDDEVNRNHSFADVFYDGSTIPFKDKEFDWVIHCAIRGGRRIDKDSKNILSDNLLMFYNLIRNQNSFKFFINFTSGAELDRSNNIGYKINEPNIFFPKI